jgi:hypothetical protein
MCKYLFLAAACVSLALLGGCARTTVEGSGGKKLTLSKPNDVTVKRGSAAQLTVKISREKFNDAVSVSIDKLPEGVEVVDTNRKIDPDDTKAEFTLKAGEKAPVVSNYESHVTVTGPDGMKATEPFKVTVKDKD